MKTRLNSLLFALLAGVGTMFATEGALSGLFSVSANKQVYFSPGNLQYQASTGTWRFAENQYDMIGNDNANVSATYSGWIDMFGWGTGNNPTLSTTDLNDYKTFTDWGTNAISNGGNQANAWRTLSTNEYAYLLETRANASSLYGLGTVGGTNGLIILPDMWESPQGASFTPGVNDYTQNNLSYETWKEWENNGAVFLPACGSREGTAMYIDGYGNYWSSNIFDEVSANYLVFNKDVFIPQSAYGMYFGFSVRLVQDKSNASNGGSTPLFPGDPGTLTLNLELKAAVVDGDEIQGYEPTGGGGYAKGSSVTIMAQDIPGYEFVQWSDSITDVQRTIVLDQSMTLTALYSHSMIEIPVAAGKWNFICLPPLGDRQYTDDMFSYDGLTDVQWGAYNGAKRAAGQSGWETPEAFNAMQGYIIFSTTAGILRINAYQDDIRQGESGNTIYAGMIDYASSHAQNANWNFVGNPYPQGYNIAGFAAAGITSPITVWNGTAYTTYTPGIDSYILNPFEAFFIQKAENGAEGITFNPEYLEGGDGGNSDGVADAMGTLPGYFSVSATQQIQFSKGNLQYQASTDTWRFAENQYDTIGALNANISATYDGWIDLFGWGTGNNPTISTKDNNDYSTFVDWGTNAISNGGNEANMWSTLTMDEWVYLFETRANASALYGQATVNGITGMIILPDDWQSVVGITFTSGTGDYRQNKYTIEQWSSLESAGAVFLPAAGSRYGTNVNYVGSNGYSWSSSPNDSDKAYTVVIGSSGLEPQHYAYRDFGYSVRLVR